MDTQHTPCQACKKKKKKTCLDKDWTRPRRLLNGVVAVPVPEDQTRLLEEALGVVRQQRQGCRRRDRRYRCTGMGATERFPGPLFCGDENRDKPQRVIVTLASFGAH